MIKKGSITVFLAMTLCLLLSLICTSLQSVRMASARTQIVNSMDIGLYSLFGQYDRTILENYDLLAIDGSFGKDSLDMASVYDAFEVYMKPVLKQNYQKLSVSQGGFSGYQLITDENGEVFFQQVVESMKETLGLQGVQLLMDQIRNRENETQNAQNAGYNLENGNSLENYDNEMNAAAQESEAAQEEMEEQFHDQGDNFTDGSVEITNVENPIPVMKRIMTMGILELVIPPEKGISDQAVNIGNLLSGRKKEQGMGMQLENSDRSYTAQIIFQNYLLDKLGNYQKPTAKGLRYQTEYVLYGQSSDRENLTMLARRLLVIREGVNFAALMVDSAKMSQVHALALGIASGFLVPPAAPVIEAALILCWSFAESVLDVRELFAGGKVPLIKKGTEWQISLQNLPKLLSGLDSMRRSYESGISYEDYLQILLLMQDKEEKLIRGMDMVEQGIRAVENRENFCLDHCLVKVEADVDVRANAGKVFNIVRRYQYI